MFRALDGSSAIQFGGPVFPYFTTGGYEVPVDELELGAHAGGDWTNGGMGDWGLRLATGLVNRLQIQTSFMRFNDEGECIPYSCEAMMGGSGHAQEQNVKVLWLLEYEIWIKLETSE